MGEFTGILDLLGALMRLFGLEENALMPALALIVVFFIIAFPIGLLAQSRRVRTGRRGMLGELGKAASEIAPEGKVYVHSEYWDAVSPEPIPPGAVIRVVGVDGMVLRVERAK